MTGGMFNLSIGQAKGLFFDRAAVMTDADRRQKRVGAIWGAFVRRVARNSIRTRKAVSQPGETPSSHVGLLRQWILFAWDPSSASTIVGPAKLNKPGMAPAALEKGGAARILERVTIGRGGMVQRHGPRWRTVRIRPRPYMQPAGDKGVAKLPGFWAEVDRTEKR